MIQTTRSRNWNAVYGERQNCCVWKTVLQEELKRETFILLELSYMRWLVVQGHGEMLLCHLQVNHLSKFNKRYIDTSIVHLAIISQLKKENLDVPFRPSLEGLRIPKYIVNTFKACWQENPDHRPDIRYVRVRLKEMQVSNF